MEQDEIQFGVVPVENSLEGSISQTYDLLLDSKLKVCGEVELRVVYLDSRSHSRNTKRTQEVKDGIGDNRRL